MLHFGSQRALLVDPDPSWISLTVPLLCSLSASPASLLQKHIRQDEQFALLEMI